MGKIRQLDAQTANMIAAGEVVERPAGVVKELVENAIDAGAGRIRISVEEGGLKRIIVGDDGCGMDSDDAVLAFQRHATSKIRETADLWSIHTLGFRGEALPSIASVAKVSLTTGTGTGGTRVCIEYGRTVSVSTYPCGQGTEITVEGLFYRTPARLKHMRSAAYENSLIQDVVARFAMSHPEIAFLFTSNEREALRTSGQGDLLEVIYRVWGRDVAEKAIPVAFEDFDYKVTGYLVNPSDTRASRNYMQVFLNGRMVRTYRIYKAIQDAYEDFIVKGRFPLAVLSVTMDPQLLDVNVHPSKWEVRLSKENQLEQLVRENLRTSLKNTMLAPAARAVPEPVRETFYEPLRLHIDPLPDAVPATPSPEEKTAERTCVQEEPLKWPAVPPEETIPSGTVPAPGFPEMKVIGQLHGKYILCDVTDGLAVLDQHACQERVHYEEIRASLDRPPVMTECLVPLTVTASDDLIQRIDELNGAVADVHIRFEEFGSDTLLVREVPVWMKDVEEETFLKDLIDCFAENREASLARLDKKKIATMACHRSIRFNRDLTMSEMAAVVHQLSHCENPYHCPHGRPTFVILSEKELIREFLR